MINLTFGEQVKIILSRKGMTIKELAEEIEAKTGKKMSRQNMTQRLSRDNFQEQDMRMIADILGCSFQLSILASLEAEKASVIEDVPPTGRELEKLLVKKEMKDARARAKREAERDLTVGEFVDMMSETEEAVPEEVMEAESVTEEAPAPDSPEEAVTEQAEGMAAEAFEAEKAEGAEAAEAEEVAEAEAEPEVMAAEELTEGAEPEAMAVGAVEAGAEPEAVTAEEVTAGAELEVQGAEPEHTVPEAPAEPEEEKKASTLDKITRIITTPKRKEYKPEVRAKDFQPIKQRADAEEDKVQGDVNPYTGHEYQSNSVRTHPKRIGYVQVYDRKEHKWTDMTEWAFLGFEERKKMTLGKDYEPPIYLD